MADVSPRSGPVAARPHRGSPVIVILIGLLIVLSLWKLETWRNPAGTLRNATHAHVLEPVDFFQEWASGRDVLEGVSIYAPQAETYQRNFDRLGFDPPLRSRVTPTMNPVNAHPPSSVLLFVPLALSTYVEAFRIWNLLSVVLIAAAVLLLRREVGPGPVRGFWLIVAVMLLVSYPLREQFHHGQLNPLLLVLIIGGWMAGRHRRDGLAGVLLGTAAAIKLFPAFLFLVPLLQRRWKTLASGAATVAVWTAATIAVMGADVYRAYVFDVMPTLSAIQSWSFNASVMGFWKKLFDSPGTGYLPVHSWMQAPGLARAGIALSALAILGAIVFAHWRAEWTPDPVLRARRDDEVFGLAVIGMLLLSPITWMHAFLLLLLPVVLLVRRMRLGSVASLALACCLLVLTARPGLWLYRFHTVHGDAREWVPPHGWWLLLTTSVQFYALVGLFVLMLLATVRGVDDARRRSASMAEA